MGGAISRRALAAGAAAAVLSAQKPEIRLPRRIRAGVLGLDGHTGEVFGQLARLPDVEVAAISDPSESALRKAPAPGAKRYTDWRRMLDSERFDVVAVCNPNGERAAAIVACAERKLNVIAEKPLATEWADLRQVREAVQRTGIRLGMLLPMRYDPPYLALRRIVRGGAIGEVGQIDAQKSYKAGERPEWMKRRASYGGTIAWIGVHMLDLMRFTSGREFRRTFGFQARFGFPELQEMETATASVFELDNGGTATLRMDYFRPGSAPTHGDDRLRLAGTRGVAEYTESTGVTVLAAGRKPEVVRDLPEAGSVFIDYLRWVYLGAPPTLAGEDIYRVCEVTLAARDAAEQRRMVEIGA